MLDDPAQVHHRDVAADVAHHGEVVRDEEVRQAELVLEAHHQVQHLRLDRDVERRDGLVGDDELRLDGERPGDTDPLPLPAAELVRLAVGRRRRQPDGVEQLLDPVAAAIARRERCTFSTSSSVWRTVIVGLSDEYGSWKTTWIRLRSSRVSRARRPSTLWPS